MRRLDYFRAFRETFDALEAEVARIAQGKPEALATHPKAGARTDPYTVFSRRLDEGNPPDRWEELLEDARRAARPPAAG